MLTTKIETIKLCELFCVLKNEKPLFYLHFSIKIDLR